LKSVRPIIEAWWKFSSPDALMFATFGWGERKGQPVPRWGKNLLRLRIRPVARKLGIPDRLVTFHVMRHVMRRTLGTDMQQLEPPRTSKACCDTPVSGLKVTETGKCRREVRCISRSRHPR